MRRIRGGLAIIVLVLCGATVAVAQPIPKEPPKGHFGFGLISTPDDEPVDTIGFLSDESCAVCHERQAKEFKGSMHSASHDDPLYRRFAEAARKEAGEKVYAYCSACHAPVGVASGLIPKASDADLPEEARSVTCDTCHQISALTGTKGPWREEANASFFLQTGKARFGSTGEVTTNRLHTGEKRDFFAKSEFCASCHTVIHPTNGLKIEHTYGEWKESVYAKNGIQCQDCHMATVEDAIQVAQTLKPVVRMGQSANAGPMRRIHPHYFVGGGADADKLAQGPEHAKQAEARLKSAARLELKTPENVLSGGELKFEVAVHNVAAGHNLPTGVTELREMWLDIHVTDSDGRTVFRSGQLDPQGRLPSDAISFGAVAADESGKATHKPWQMTRFIKTRTIPPKGVERETIVAKIPTKLSGNLSINARLLFRSAPADVATWLFPDKSYVPKITEMTQAKGTVRIGGTK